MGEKEGLTPAIHTTHPKAVSPAPRLGSEFPGAEVGLAEVWRMVRSGGWQTTP